MEKIITVAALLAAAAVGMAAPAHASFAIGQLSALQRPAILPAENGDVLSSEPGVFYLDPLKVIKVDAGVHRIMYSTTDRSGKAIAVTGTVLNPRTSPYGQRPIVAFAPARRASRTSAPPRASWPKAPNTRRCPSRSSSTRATPWW
ncbi:hypothetical protein [Streptomyces goshikiensis]|uniref:hypothetical protein n=1 Tax=Streptomyces goshikiensis TaxID=1942 RepID=UPI00365E93D4